METLVSIFGFALVSCVAASVTVWSITSVLRQRLRALESWHATTEKHLLELYEKVDRTHNAKLAAEVDDLRAAMLVAAASNRREFGKLWAKERRASPQKDALDLQEGADDDLRAFLALQGNLPIKAGGSE